MKKFVFALFATLGLVGFVTADTYNATITKVDGNKVTVTKAAAGGAGKAAGKKGAGKKGAAPAQPATPEVLELATGAEVGKGKQDAAQKGPAAWSLDSKFSDGVKNEAFKDASDATPVAVKITTADEDKGAVKKGQITEILTITKGGGKGGKKGAGTGK